MSYQRKVILSFVLVIISVLTAFGIDSYQSMSKLNEKVIRLHVLANSNTDEDQELKLKVRNEIVSKFNQEFKYAVSKEDSEKIIINKLEEIRVQAEETIEKEGYDYKVNVFYGNYHFPRKQYKDIVLPEGNYDALKIEIGMAEGNNWWCVMFPQLCFVDFGDVGTAEPIFNVDTESQLSEILTAEEIEMIKTKRGLEEITLKSKFFEFVEKGRLENTGVLASDEQRTYASSLSEEEKKEYGLGEDNEYGSAGNLENSETEQTDEDLFKELLDMFKRNTNQNNKNEKPVNIVKAN